MWSDKETSKDLLGYTVHAELLKGVVTNDKNLPITVGLYGDWGSGKSSILKILEEDLKKDENTVVNVGLKNVTAGANPMDLKRGIDKAVAAVVADLKKRSQSVGEDYSKIEQVGTVSANNDSQIGKLIADAMSKVKKDGVITVEDICLFCQYIPTCHLI